MSLVVVREGCGAALLHRQAGLSSVERLDLALLVNRQNAPSCATSSAFMSIRRTTPSGELEPTHSVRLQAVGPPDALYRTYADPDRFAMAAAVQWVAFWDGLAKVKATTRSATSGANGGARAASCPATGRRRLRR